MPAPRSKLFALSLIACAACAQAAPSYVALGSPMPRFSLLKEGSHRYLRYVKDGETNTPMDIWQRTVKFDGQRVAIHQRWDGVGKPAPVKILDSTFDRGTFRPLQHVRITERDGKRTVEGFNFAPERITGQKDLADNAQKDLDMASPEGTFNFETDIEMLQTLPLEAGYEAAINFYHPGGLSAPARYTFKVMGSETISGPSGAVDCWVVTTDYNRAGYESKFWFAKATQQMVRQISPMLDGKVLVKTLID
ncbi:DUF3108 domain-containing protein [Massilia endophytica]|uniref:DUF3108 domain-containing protein n=1 Tax=Massilia endophytica TaxID=2899220 RepID=UPI001E5DFD39|nr:DUF3108 domain-containing protein [Massilia endophytica]UGQ47158.1 DUF3108 domain-containing protein [Massilia endophytica]